jgi:carboxymethylenebutenolidase
MWEDETLREAEVTIQTADGEMDMFVCRPDEGGPHPAVVFYMDAPGIREELRDMARRIATVGYYVALPNLYYRRGREGDYGFDMSRIRDDDGELQKMFAAMNSLTNAGVVADTKPLLDFLEGETEAASGPKGCVGYCMSGRFVMAVAAAYADDFAAIASYYGVGIVTEADDSPHLTAAAIKGEVYLAFAEDDVYVPDAVLTRLPAIMEKSGAPHRIEVYPGTSHGFAFPQRPAYDKPAAERHWQRLFALFDRRLRG